jgi:hypothetical protein
VDGVPITVFALCADEEQLVVVATEERLFVALHALFVAEYTVAARIERGGVVAALHTARAAHIQNAVGPRARRRAANIVVVQRSKPTRERGSARRASRARSTWRRTRE